MSSPRGRPTLGQVLLVQSGCPVRSETQDRRRILVFDSQNIVRDRSIRELVTEKQEIRDMIDFSRNSEKNCRQSVDAKSGSSWTCNSI